MREKLKVLIHEWEADAKYLDGPNDYESDKAAGQTYAECAKRLRDILDQMENKE